MDSGETECGIISHNRNQALIKLRAICRHKLLSRSFYSLQIACSLMANATVLSSGMGLGFPAITLEALKDEQNPMRLNNEQASWFGSFN